MKVIKELIRVLDKSKLQPINVLDFSNTRMNKYKSYYDAILNDEYLDEDELALKFSENTVSSKKYLMFKNRFRKRLSNYVFFMDYSGVDKAINFVSKAYRFTFMAKLLMLVGAKNGSYYFTNKSLKLAVEYELYELLLIINQIYITKYSFSNNYNKLNLEIEKQNENLIYYSNELKIEALYAKSGIIISKSEILSKINFDNYENIIFEINKLSESNKVSFKSFWLAKSCEIEYCEYIGDYKKVLQNCIELDNLLIEKPQFSYNVRKLVLATWKLEAYGALGKLEAAKTLLEELDELVKKNVSNWFHVQRKVFEFYFNTKQYEKALHLSLKVLEHEGFKSYNSRFKEIWILRNAYASLICAVLNLDSKLTLKEVKIEKVLNSISSMSKDKLGVNLATIVLEIMYKYFNNDMDDLIDKYNVLMHYKIRYLKPAKLTRATIFFNFIVRTSQKGFMKDVIKKESDRALQKLSNVKNQNAEKRSYEIIPYEDIIEMMLAKKK